MRTSNMRRPAELMRVVDRRVVNLMVWLGRLPNLLGLHASSSCG